MNSKLRNLAFSVFLVSAGVSHAESDQFLGGINEITDKNLRDFITYQDKKVSETLWSCKQFFKDHFAEDAVVGLNTLVDTGNGTDLLRHELKKPDFVDSCRHITKIKTPIENIRISQDGLTATYNSITPTHFCITNIALDSEGTMTIQASECLVAPPEESEPPKGPFIGA